MKTYKHTNPILYDNDYTFKVDESYLVEVPLGPNHSEMGYNAQIFYKGSFLVTCRITESRLLNEYKPMIDITNRLFRIKSKWCDSPEEKHTLYIVTEDNGDRLFAKPFESKLSIVPTSLFKRDMINLLPPIDLLDKTK
jgi:hypothetical protein